MLKLAKLAKLVIYVLVSMVMCCAVSTASGNFELSLGSLLGAAEHSIPQQSHASGSISIFTCLCPLVVYIELPAALLSPPVT